MCPLAYLRACPMPCFADTEVEPVCAMGEEPPSESASECGSESAQEDNDNVGGADDTSAMSSDTGSDSGDSRDQQPSARESGDEDLGRAWPVRRPRRPAAVAAVAAAAAAHAGRFQQAAFLQRRVHPGRGPMLVGTVMQA